MKGNEKNISLKEAIQLNHRAYKLFFQYYPKLILSRIILTVWKALTPYIIIYLSALVIEELAGNRSPERIRFLVTITLLSGAGISLISAFLEKWKSNLFEYGRAGRRQKSKCRFAKRDGGYMCFCR